MKVEMKVLDTQDSIPKRRFEGDAGYDLLSRVDILLQPGERAKVPTGIALAIPQGYAGFLLPRSGLALDSGITLANAPGLLDSSYRGEIGAIVINIDSEKPVEVRRGDRICQLVIQKVETIDFVAVSDLPITERADRGFGSTDRRDND